MFTQAKVKHKTKYFSINLHRNENGKKTGKKKKIQKKEEEEEEKEEEEQQVVKVLGTTGWNTWRRRTRERAKLSEIVRAITSMKYLQQGWDSRRNFETEPRNFSNLETFFE